MVSTFDSHSSNMEESFSSLIKYQQAIKVMVLNLYIMILQLTMLDFRIKQNFEWIY